VARPRSPRERERETLPHSRVVVHDE